MIERWEDSTRRLKAEYDTHLGEKLDNAQQVCRTTDGEDPEDRYFLDTRNCAVVPGATDGHGWFLFNVCDPFVLQAPHTFTQLVVRTLSTKEVRTNSFDR